MSAREFSPSDIIDMAVRAGIMLSTAHGQETVKLMPISDVATLKKFADLAVAKREADTRRETLLEAKEIAYGHRCADEFCDCRHVIAYRLEKLREKANSLTTPHK